LPLLTAGTYAATGAAAVGRESPRDEIFSLILMQLLASYMQLVDRRRREQELPELTPNLQSPRYLGSALLHVLVMAQLHIHTSFCIPFFVIEKVLL
jgi:hypothetical protein